MSLEAALRLLFTSGFYWDRSGEARAFSEHFYERQKAMPSMVQTGMYSATMHYLNVVKSVGSDDALEIEEQMKTMPINNFYTHNGKIRADGRMIYDLYLTEVKGRPSKKANGIY
ncbi:substrate-binding family protein [Advenella incenata]|uniref:Substrate-binding family protein n=1 Tax=Advenella incenata TaxID=267800 RepID=A0A4Q7VDG2_9BURK|nr:ABC transporter substrate-binding protein [Advenella incenata]RZT94845.1 substrate-binding family protein [Advenella incenata]